MGDMNKEAVERINDAETDRFEYGRHNMIGPFRKGNWVRDSDYRALLRECAAQSARIAELESRQPTVQEAAKVLLSQTTIAEKKVMNEAGIDAMRPGGFTFADMVDFDTGRIAALRALSEATQ